MLAERRDDRAAAAEYLTRLQQWTEEQAGTIQDRATLARQIAISMHRVSDDARVIETSWALAHELDTDGQSLLAELARTQQRVGQRSLQRARRTRCETRRFN